MLDSVKQKIINARNTLRSKLNIYATFIGRDFGRKKMSAFNDLEAVLNQGATPTYLLVSKAFYECQTLLAQYRDDLHYPPSLIQRTRRLKELKKVVGV